MEYRQVKKLTPASAAYLAGLIDGEGTVTLSRRNRNKQRELVVSVSNTEMPILEYIQTVSGVGKITKKRTTSSLHTPSFTYQVSNRQALSLLKQVAPYMQSHKASRAKLVLKDYIRLTPRNGRYTNEQLQERENFIVKFFAIRSNSC